MSRLALATAAETLRLNELLDDGEPAVDLDEIHAAQVVRRLANGID